MARPFHEKWLQICLRVAIAFTIGFLVCQIPLEYPEAWTYDWRVRLSPTSPTSRRIEMVNIDPDTLRALQKEPDAVDHTDLLKKLLAQNPEKIVYIIDPAALAGTPRQKEELAQVMANPRVIVAVNELPPVGQIDFLKLPRPFDRVAVGPGPTTVDRSVFAKDGVTRRLIISSDGQPTYQLSLAEEVLARRIPTLRGQFDLLDSPQAYIHFHPPGTYPNNEFQSVRSGDTSADRFKNKIVLIGRDTRESIKDYIMTPYSREGIAMSVVEMHANIIDTILLDNAPRPASSRVDFILSILFSLLTVYVVLKVRPLTGLGVLAVSLVGFVLTSYALFAGFDLWVPMAHPLAAVFVCYYFIIPYRLIMENRRSWEYLQKNKLLTQVEELKSNFLRMMSHDLRTPLARIQGMANVVLSDGNPLSETQRRAVETIYRSSEELSAFIGSILSLGRIESKEIKLHLRSRDINSVLIDVIRKCEFLGRKHGIEIRTEFEPMFSFKVDEDLIRQVFTNLIENAIKYSPDGGKILVSTEEVNGQAVIQVADQGIGIPNEDLPFVFEKFFRSRNVSKGEVSGSGLGLYLVKYFIELHHGRVEVESEPAKGSTFTVILPMVMDSQTRAVTREGDLHV